MRKGHRPGDRAQLLPPAAPTPEWTREREALCAQFAALLHHATGEHLRGTRDLVALFDSAYIVAAEAYVSVERTLTKNANRSDPVDVEDRSHAIEHWRRECAIRLRYLADLVDDPSTDWGPSNETYHESTPETKQ